MNQKIINHLNACDYDIRKSNNARFMDQKVTPDVLCIIADCVLAFIKSTTDREFTTRDIWNSPYANENIKGIFKKPDVQSKSAQSEYDKFFAQPLKMLAYSKVLSERKKSGKIYFTIKNNELLEYISIKEKNSLNFIDLYLKKVLQDSGIWHLFKKFFDKPERERFNELKKEYSDFIIKHTPINFKVEVNRVFTKVLNPLSYGQDLHGAQGGYLSKDRILYNELMYNRKNWRDIKKFKDETRENHKKRIEETKTKNKCASKYNISKAKKLIKERHGPTSEISDELSAGKATHVHHIFPRSYYPTIDSYLENLILLTASQHSTKAHPNNNTREIDKCYQKLCLDSKISSIEQSVEELKDGFYSKEDLIFVLNTGIEPHESFDMNKSFQEIKAKIKSEYNNYSFQKKD